MVVSRRPLGGRGGSLIRVTRERVERVWLERHPRLRALSPEERADWIGDCIGLPGAQVHDALYGDPADEGRLVDRTALLQRLWVARCLRASRQQSRCRAWI